MCRRYAERKPGKSRPGGRLCDRVELGSVLSSLYKLSRLAKSAHDESAIYVPMLAVKVVVFVL